MNAEIYAEWLRCQGHKIYRTPSTYWYDAAPRVLQAFPYHWVISPGKDEIRELIVKNGIVAVRYSAPPDYYEGKVSYHIILNKCYNLNTLSPKARNGVKRGLVNFKVEEIALNRLATEGWILQADTLLRQHREGSMSQKKWEILCRAAGDLPGFHAFAAISEGELAGALIVCHVDDVVTVPYAASHCRFLHQYVNNALFFSVCCELLKQESVREIFFCVESLDAPAHVDEFKLRMGFETRTVRQRVDVHPVFKPVAVPALHHFTRTLLNHFPYSCYLSKAEGVLRFYIDGKRPASEQPVPGCIAMHP